MNSERTVESTAMDEHRGKHSLHPSNLRSKRWLTKSMSRHEQTLSFFPHRPQSAASGKVVKDADRHSRSP